MEASPSVGGSAITVWKLDGLGLSGGQLAGRDRRRALLLRRGLNWLRTWLDEQRARGGIHRSLGAVAAAGGAGQGQHADLGQLAAAGLASCRCRGRHRRPSLPSVHSMQAQAARTSRWQSSTACVPLCSPPRWCTAGSTGPGFFPCTAPPGWPAHQQAAWVQVRAVDTRQAACRPHGLVDAAQRHQNGHATPCSLPTPPTHHHPHTTTHRERHLLEPKQQAAQALINDGRREAAVHDARPAAHLFAQPHDGGEALPRHVVVAAVGWGGGERCWLRQTHSGGTAPALLRCTQRVPAGGGPAPHPVRSSITP